MPLTPRFAVSQDDIHIIISIKVPYVKISSTDIIVHDTEFHFYCKPYLLKLNFPGALEEDEEKYTHLHTYALPILKQIVNVEDIRPILMGHMKIAIEKYR